MTRSFNWLGSGSDRLVANDTGDLTGVASYDQGEWSVIFKRPLRVASGAPFSPGQFMPIAFSVWDGFSRERGNRRGLMVWYSLYVEPEVVPSAAGPMIRTALVPCSRCSSRSAWNAPKSGLPAPSNGVMSATNEPSSVSLGIGTGEPSAHGPLAR